MERPCADRWVVVLRSVRAGAPQSAGQRAAALQARRVMLPCGAPRVTSQLVRADRIRTSIVVRTFMVGPTRIMAGALLRQVSRQGPLLVPRQPPHTTTPTTRITRNPIIHLTAGHLTRRPTPRTVRIPIRTAAMCKARQAVALTAALAAATFNAKAQEADIAAGHAFAREACKVCHADVFAEVVRNRTGVPRYREHPGDDNHGPYGLSHHLTPEDAKSYPHAEGDGRRNRVYLESRSSSLSRAVIIAGDHLASGSLLHRACAETPIR